MEKGVRPIVKMENRWMNIKTEFGEAQFLGFLLMFSCIDSDVLERGVFVFGRGARDEWEKKGQGEPSKTRNLDHFFCSHSFSDTSISP